MIHGDPWHRGYERFGENNSEAPCTEEKIDACFQKLLKKAGEVPEENREFVRATFTNLPYIEGAWMTKYGGHYYLQYACPGAEQNVYTDGVYVSDAPLGPFHPARNNPYSYKPGGFLSGAGHGSTMEDTEGHFWHAATMRVSVNYVFERRVGLWPAGFDDRGELFCNQHYGDWPIDLEKLRCDPWTEPEWILLSYGKAVTSSPWVDAAGVEAQSEQNEHAQGQTEAGTEQAAPVNVRIRMTRAENIAAYGTGEVLLDVEEYLRGVVPSEMYEPANIEALKAQAICARTYAVYRRDSVLTDSGNHQAFRAGKIGKNPRSDEAIAATRGMVLTYNGKLVNCFYSSSNHGQTKRSGDVWRTHYPYYVSKADEWDEAAREGLTLPRSGMALGCPSTGQCGRRGMACRVRPFSLSTMKDACLPPSDHL